MDQGQKNYEICYLLPSSLPEEDILAYTGKISAIIEDQRGVIKHGETPKKQRLSYAIKKEHNAYFGWTTFRMLPEQIAGLEKKIKIEPIIMRHLIVEEETRLKAPVFRMPTAKPSIQRPTAIPREAEKTEEKLDLEALDKKLEEILGK